MSWADRVRADGFTRWHRFNEASGNIQDEATSNPNSLSISGSPTYQITGALPCNNYAVQFDADTEYGTFPQNDELDFSAVGAKATWEFWIQILSTGSTANAYLWAMGSGVDPNNTPQILTQVDAADSTLCYVKFHRNNSTTITSSAITTDEWHHIVIVYEDAATDEILIYSDGSQIAAGSLAGGLAYNSGYRTLLSSDPFDFNEGSDIVIDELVIYKDVALTSTQVLAHYNGGCGSPGWGWHSNQPYWQVVRGF